MQISFKGEYKSLSTFESEELSKFTVITGKNGSGKSQLVELIKTLEQNKSDNQEYQFEIKPIPTKIQVEGITNKNIGVISNEIWKQKISHLHSKFIQFDIEVQRFYQFLKENNLTSEQIRNKGISSHFKKSDHPDLFDKIKTALSKLNRNFRRIQKIDNSIYETELIHSIFGSNEDLKFFDLICFLADYNNKSILNLTESDFHNTPTEEFYFDNNRLFSSEVEVVFYGYARKRHLNQYHYFRKKTFDEKNNTISDTEFLEKFPPPWVMINKVLEENNSLFRFMGIEAKDFNPDVQTKFKLIRNDTNSDVEFEDLSSGEKVIIGLIIKLFISNYYKERLVFPDLLVLDEPDAYLHPEMTHLLLNVLYNTFVLELGINVIMVTHSPSTIALCPEESIYQMNNYPTCSLTHISKNEALKILTGFIPTLSIDYENHKQVFVESPTDVKFYQILFNKLNQEYGYPFELYFISNSYGKGNCDQVKKLVKDLRESGNNTSFGIIDWDNKNKSEEFIKVHGQNHRYSIENYLFDPIYLAVLLMNLKAHNIHKNLEIDESENHYSIGSESNEYLQRIADYIFNKYYDTFKNLKEIDKNSLIPCHYLNDKIIKLPTWFLNFNGHDFENRIKEVFPVLNKKYSGDELKMELAITFGRCYPLIPVESKHLIESIINNNH